MIHTSKVHAVCNTPLTFNLQRLLNGIELIPATVIETRNYIARPNEHKHQTFEFGELRVQLRQVKKRK